MGGVEARVSFQKVHRKLARVRRNVADGFDLAVEDLVEHFKERHIGGPTTTPTRIKKVTGRLFDRTRHTGTKKVGKYRYGKIRFGVWYAKYHISKYPRANPPPLTYGTRVWTGEIIDKRLKRFRDLMAFHIKRN